MKTKIILTAILFVILAGMVERTEARSGNAHFSYFYENLRGHGRWIVLDDDFIVWQPYRMRAGWAPYYSGSWVWTDYGWYWDTDEPFGYIVYHYGRWHYDDYYGWIWVPDYEWAPAWVDWRYNDDYIGWAPLPPYAQFRRGSGIYFTINFQINYVHWHFVKYRDFHGPYFERNYVPSHYKYRVYNNTRREEGGLYYDNGVRNRGIDRSIVERRSGKTLRQRDLQFGNNDERKPGAIERINVRRADFENARTIDVREMKLETGKTRSSLKIQNIEIGEKRSRLNEERERKPEIKERNKDVNTNENNERQRIERQTPVTDRTDDRTTPIQLERKQAEERKTELNRNSGSREMNKSESVNRTSERQKTEAPAVNEKSRERNREVAPLRESKASRENESVRTRENTRTNKSGESERTGTRTKERERR